MDHLQSKMKNRLRLCLRLQLIWVVALIVLRLILPDFGTFDSKFDIVLFIKHGISLLVGIAALITIDIIQEKSFAFTDSIAFRRLYFTNKCISILILIQILTDYLMFFLPSTVRI